MRGAIHCGMLILYFCYAYTVRMVYCGYEGAGAANLTDCNNFSPRCRRGMTESLTESHRSAWDDGVSHGVSPLLQRYAVGPGFVGGPKRWVYRLSASLSRWVYRLSASLSRWVYRLSASLSSGCRARSHPTTCGFASFALVREMRVFGEENRTRQSAHTETSRTWAATTIEAHPARRAPSCPPMSAGGVVWDWVGSSKAALRTSRCRTLRQPPRAATCAWFPRRA
jgi:hypothetical protein